MAFVKLKNGTFLQNPIFIGKDWFIKCDDDSGLMLYVKSQAKTLKSIKARMRKILKVAGISAELLVERGYQTTTSFPPEYAGLVKCWVWGLQLNKPMPSRLAAVDVGKTRIRPDDKELVYGK